MSIADATPEKKAFYAKNLRISAWMSIIAGSVILTVGLVLMSIGIVTANTAPSIEGSTYFVAEITEVDTETASATYESLNKETEGLSVEYKMEKETDKVGDRRAFYLLEDGKILPTSEWSTIQLWLGLGFGLSIFLYVFAAIFLIMGFAFRNIAKKTISN